MSDVPTSPEIELLCALIRRASVTPDDAGCQAVIIERLEAIGFHCETLVFGDTTNLWARRGSDTPLLCLAGHTDVVPPGNLDEWQSPPFQPTVRDGDIFGRGSADMKGGLAAMVVALEQFVAVTPQHRGSLAMLVTSDEEGHARDGTLRVMQVLAERDENIDWCVLGEPSSQSKLGDRVRVGRRGSLSGMLTVKGIQGHVAYPHLADNPIHRFAPILAELQAIEWDQGNEFFPPTSFQIVDIQSGIGAPNVTPDVLTARFNFRYSTVWDHASLKKRVLELFDAHDIDYEVRWHLSGEPFLTTKGKLTEAVMQAVKEHTGEEPELSTGGGTSDGRFISPAGADIVELGPISTSIHKIDEHVRIDDIVQLTSMYRRIMTLLL